MINCIGTMPDLASISRIPGAASHDYGKSPRANRKVGHITVTASTPDLRDERMRAVERLIEP
jgi:5-(carboxyamino)imidazole ribonucleotide synthase